MASPSQVRYQPALHRPRAVAGFEPATSLSGSSTSLSYTAYESVQRDSNPRFLLGKQACYH